MRNQVSVCNQTIELLRDKIRPTLAPYDECAEILKEIDAVVEELEKMKGMQDSRRLTPRNLADLAVCFKAAADLISTLINLS